MSCRPEVSVIIATLNRRAMVREAVESILAQRGTAFELIVIDDGSSDGTTDDLEILAAGHRHAVRVALGAGRGVAAARNLGLSLARSPWIAFLDSDDLWAEMKLLRQLAFMGAHPELWLSQCNERWLRNGRWINPARRHLKRGGEIFIDSLERCLISPSAVILKTQLLQSLGGFDEQMTVCEDYDLWLRILREHEAGLLDEYLVTRRAGHPGQLSATVAAPDRFRILALVKLLAAGGLSAEQRGAVCRVLQTKCGIYTRGLARRENGDVALFEFVGSQAMERWRHGASQGLTDAVGLIRGHIAVGQSHAGPPAAPMSPT